MNCAFFLISYPLCFRVHWCWSTARDPLSLLRQVFAWGAQFPVMPDAGNRHLSLHCSNLVLPVFDFVFHVSDPPRHVSVASEIRAPCFSPQ